HVPILTDARFSGVSTGACIGHIGPEGLAGGPIGRLRDGDTIEIIIDRNELTGSINFVGVGDSILTQEQASQTLAQRTPHPNMRPNAKLPDDTRLWAALQAVSGGVWNGSVYDVDKIIAVLDAGTKALAQQAQSTTAGD
ncbi:MAG: dihydroxy-acid dehydratase, partial [Anaerolineae bacterium]|nr:dihydroxy-acid dehydratase [Anaerolineae bacterium]